MSSSPSHLFFSFHPRTFSILFIHVFSKAALWPLVCLLDILTHPHRREDDNRLNLHLQLYFMLYFLIWERHLCVCLPQVCVQFFWTKIHFSSCIQWHGMFSLASHLGMKISPLHSDHDSRIWCVLDFLVFPCSSSFLTATQSSLLKSFGSLLLFLLNLVQSVVTNRLSGFNNYHLYHWDGDAGQES